MFLQIGPPARHRAPPCTSVKTKLNAATATPMPAPSRRAIGFVVFEAWSTPWALTLLFTSIFVEFRFVRVPAPLSGLPATLALGP